MSSLGEAIIHLGIDLFHQIRKSEKENIFLLPFSISSALAMTYLGARENTASEMQKVLHFNEITEKPRGTATRNPVRQRALDVEEVPLFVGFSRQEYCSGLPYPPPGDLPTPETEPASLMSPASADRKNQGSVSQRLSRQLYCSGLVNAVYFKGQWNQKFKKENTVEEKFRLNKDASKPVQMMKQTNSFNFMSPEDVQAKILEIPYKGSELSMMVLLPDEVDGLQELEDQLTAEKLIAWTSPQNMRKRQVDLYLPRFKVEESYDLVPTLQALGMVDAFRDGVADFSGMTGGRDLVVSKVFHKSFVEVTEEGTEAAAATDVEIIERAGRNSESFRCDHPFLFLIKHIKTNSILFCGRVSSP